jgi:hypothetical protein
MDPSPELDWNAGARKYAPKMKINRTMAMMRFVNVIQFIN